MKQNEYGFNERYQGKEIVRFNVNYIEDETQYGTGYGDILVIPGYFNLICASDN